MRKGRILVVDDEQDILELARFILEEEGYSVEKASDGEEALEKIKQNAPDLVLLDVLMPKLNGLEVCRKIRANPKLVALPIILFTVRGQYSDVENGLEAGANEYITKPFPGEKLVNVVNKYLDPTTETEGD